MVVVGDGNQQVAVYAPNLPNQLAMAVQGVDLGSVVGVAFTADNKEVLTCGGDGKIHLTAGPKPDGSSAGDTASRKQSYLGHVGAVTALALVPRRASTSFRAAWTGASVSGRSNPGSKFAPSTGI